MSHTITPDTFHFLRAWISAPRLVGALAPSGRALADLITSEVGPHSGPVLELGPGTGVFTRALLARGVPEDRLTLVEYGAEFAEMLRGRFPAARVLQMDAGRLARRQLFSDAPLGAVISGLPLLNMSLRTTVAILAGAFGYMRPRGSFYQFTYGPVCPVPRPVLDRLGLKATFVGRAMLNIPPAAVYRITARNRPAG
ncbi:methyltransferase domain-containing protein [Aquabacter sp. CN5-332]|uniref:class I SAM-dependent methyltransferase n=1 Tax=Aquabacter sp. CN5-332 TaxID=3156608 RepID=UPI0032B581BA